MGSIIREKKGPLSWKEQALESITPPPLPLVVFFGIFIMLIGLATYLDFMHKLERSKMGFRFGLLLLPLAGIVVVTAMLLPRRWWRYVFGVGRPTYNVVANDQDGSVPWGLLLVVVLLLVMVHYQSSFRSAWFIAL